MSRAPGVLEIALRAREQARLPDEAFTTLHLTPGPLNGTSRAAEADRALDAILTQPAFTRVRHLVLAPSIPMTWEGLTKFCSRRETRALEALTLDLYVDARALLAVLATKAFARVTELTLSTRYGNDIPRGTPAPPPTLRQGFDKVDGLPALRRLWLSGGIEEETLGRVLRSPLVRRVEALGLAFGAGGELRPFDGVALPNVRALTLFQRITREITAAIAGAFPALEVLDLADAAFDAEALRPLAETRSKSPLTLDISNHRDHERRRVELLRRHDFHWIAPIAKPAVRALPADLLATLRDRFGERLMAEGVEAESSKSKSKSKGSTRR